ncbi:RNA polymerase sigma factor region1.1 domain-containing protein [Paenibacillus beijingensis]|uniref:RNA polymerase sigma factor 70 region 1.1 domain-containing protein n=1 Tax=Paenibacillus beijingensis TaxID=1126833 RepID=A0A0D5NDK6_9BACL|nr:hypothetical protein VN24_00010 [Paenibacillus beijingensis]
MANYLQSETEMTLQQVQEQLIRKGKEQFSLSYNEIVEKLDPFELTPEQFDAFFERLSGLEIEIIEPGRSQSGSSDIPKKKKGTGWRAS